MTPGAMTTRTASCRCGQFRVTTNGDPARVSICHCIACQRRTGSVFGAQARFGRTDVGIHGRSTEYVRISDDGGRITLGFCPICGSTVHYAIDGQDDVVAVPVGAFAEPGFPAPTCSVYEVHKHAWFGLPEGIEHPR